MLDIEELAFHGNGRLEEVVLCGPIKHLRQSVFSECESLKRLYLPVGIKKISATFDDCNLKEISVPLGKVEYYKRRLHESLHTLIVENFEIPDVPFDIVMSLIIPGPITEIKRKWLMRQREACKRRCEQFEVTVASLEEYLDKRVFKKVDAVTIHPDIEDMNGLDKYTENYIKLLEVEKSAIENV